MPISHLYRFIQALPRPFPVLSNGPARPTVPKGSLLSQNELRETSVLIASTRACSIDEHCIALHPESRPHQHGPERRGPPCREADKLVTCKLQRWLLHSQLLSLYKSSNMSGACHYRTPQGYYIGTVKTVSYFIWLFYFYMYLSLTIFSLNITFCFKEILFINFIFYCLRLICNVCDFCPHGICIFNIIPSSE